MWGLGFWDILIILFVVLLIFGTKRLPEMGRSLGGGLRGFKDALTERVEKHDAESDAEETRQLPPAPPAAGEPQLDPREHDTVV